MHLVCVKEQMFALPFAATDLCKESFFPLALSPFLCKRLQLMNFHRLREHCKHTLTNKWQLQQGAYYRSPRAPDSKGGPLTRAFHEFEERHANSGDLRENRAGHRSCKERRLTMETFDLWAIREWYCPCRCRARPLKEPEELFRSGPRNLGRRSKVEAAEPAAWLLCNVSHAHFKTLRNNVAFIFGEH